MPIMIPRRLRSLLFGSLLLLACGGFIALGHWQLQRRSWKLDLIARVETRLKQPARPAPVRPEWPGLTAKQDEYRRVCTSGYFRPQDQVAVQAVTRLGPGTWMLTPLQLDDDTLVYINRGFVDADHRAVAQPTAGNAATIVCGLLRFSEPGGAFLHHNDPANQRWYSRDLYAIAASRGLNAAAVAPYFIDADAGPDPTSWPRGGLTVVQFRNSHLSYALTWYGLALLSALAVFRLIHLEYRVRVQSPTSA